jgi:alpha-glucosidase
LAADLQTGVEGSTLELYRSVLSLRRAHGLGSGTFQWAEEHDPANGVLAFRNRDVLVVVNMGTATLPVPAGLRAELTSDGGSGSDSIAPDSAAYLVSQ